MKPFNSLSTENGTRKNLTGYVTFPTIYKKELSDGTIEYYNEYDYGTNQFSEKVSDITAFRNEIKKQIKENGSVGSAIFQYIGDKDVYKPANHSSITNSDGTMKLPNHAILIIGWDDDYYPSDNNGAQSAENDAEWKNRGAYIALNSYGKDEYDNGYIYISYDDFYIEQMAYGITDVSKDEFDNIYYNDELGCEGNITSPSSQITVYNVFTRKTTEKEIIKQIGIASFINQIANIYYTDEFDSTGRPIKFRINGSVTVAQSVLSKSPSSSDINFRRSIDSKSLSFVTLFRNFFAFFESL